MCRLIYDFIKSSETINGYGCFEGKATALSLAQGMSKSQKRQFRRYRIIPGAFYYYLKKVGMILEERHISKEKRTVDGLLDLLWNSTYRNQRTRFEAEWLRWAILKEKYPMLRKSFGGAEHIWKRGEESIY